MAAKKPTTAEDLSAFEAMTDLLEEPDRTNAKTLLKLVAEVAPRAQPSTWYGMPAFKVDGRPIMFFQSGIKFKTRYSTLGFTHHSHLDDGSLWPTSFAIANLDEAASVTVREVIARAFAV